MKVSKLIYFFAILLVLLLLPACTIHTLPNQKADYEPVDEFEISEEHRVQTYPIVKIRFRTVPEGKLSEN